MAIQSQQESRVGRAVRPAREAAKADRNRAYARSLGWGAHLTAVRRALNRRRTVWNEVTLVTETAKWQARTGLDSDGVIGPATWSLLRVAAGLAKDPVISVRLPDSGPGFYTYPPGRGHHRFGRAETIRALQIVAAAWQQAHPRGPRIGIGDISLHGGGPIRGHGSHRLGLDVDIRPLRADGPETPVLQGQPGYSQALTQELVDRLRDNGVLRVHFILFNDSGVRGVRPWSGHDDHLHVRFAPPTRSGASQATGAKAAEVTTPALTTPAQPRLGTLTVQVPGPAGGTPAYRFSPEDLVWTARFLIGEAGGRDDPASHAVLHAMFNRYALLTRPYYRTFHAFLRAYSTPLQPVLNDWRAARRHMHHPDFAPRGGTYGPRAPAGIPKGQLRTFLDLQRRPWEQLPLAARTVALRALSGALPNPVGNATEFGSPRQYFRDRFGRFPNAEEWRRYTEEFARSEGLLWIGPVPGLDQARNTFFVRRKFARLPAGAVRILPP
ncbi:penicillin-insensitive murein endopeptidase [Streptomyces sp. DASNCL29]|uniref:penicillin-insensitive murein endopeptidase n=1 Tax=Streptomyces sp. DASNCL29 TaxID=2583819 RepID=UPI00110FDF6D|nr:penicillin-insensitive murein endopeptidase [Streptomyces sp. DASNCL29]TMV00038.1 hypothetical protein FGK60_21805 [Streptomyces sp. DASNCL29]